MQTQAETLKAQIAEKDKALVSPIFSKFRESQAKKQALDRHVETLDGMIAAATTGREGLEAAPMPGEPSASLASDQLLRQLHDTLKAAHHKALALSSEALDVLGASRGEAIKARTEWLEELENRCGGFGDFAIVSIPAPTPPLALATAHEHAPRPFGQTPGLDERRQ